MKLMKSLVVLSLVVSVAACGQVAPAPQSPRAIVDDSSVTSQLNQLLKEGNNLVYNAFELSRKGDVSKSNDAYKQAEQKFRGALELYPNNMDALKGLARTQSDLKNYDSARETLNKVLKINPKDEGAYEELATVEEQLGNYQAAASNYRQIIKLYPNDIKTYVQLEALSDKHRLGVYDARAEFKTKNPENPEMPDEQIKKEFAQVYYSNALTWFQDGKFEDALAMADKAIKINPEDKEASIVRTEILFALRDEYQKKAVEQLTKTIALEKGKPDNNLNYYIATLSKDEFAGLKKLYPTLGQYEAAKLALDYYQKNMDANPVTYGMGKKIDELKLKFSGAMKAPAPAVVPVPAAAPAN